MIPVEEHPNPAPEFTIACAPCRGTGLLPGQNHISPGKAGPPNCYHCNGQGVVPAVVCPTCGWREEPLPFWPTCRTCKGEQLIQERP